MRTRKGSKELCVFSLVSLVSKQTLVERPSNISIRTQNNGNAINIQPNISNTFGMSAHCNRFIDPSNVRSMIYKVP